MFIYQFCIQRFNTLSGIFPSPPRSRGALFQILLESRQNFTGSLLVIKKKKNGSTPAFPALNSGPSGHFLEEGVLVLLFPIPGLDLHMDPLPSAGAIPDRLCSVFSDGTKDRSTAWQNQEEV